MNIYTYSDSEAGMQNVSFDKLSELIQYIENFDPVGDSTGLIYENDTPILSYINRGGNLNFIKPL